MTLLTHIIQMALFHISPLSFWGFRLRSLRFCLRSTEAEPRQDFGRGENLACVYKAWRNEGKWLRISSEVTLTCRPQPASLQAQRRSSVLCHSRSSPFFLSFCWSSFFIQAALVFWTCWTSFFKKRGKLILPTQKNANGETQTNWANSTLNLHENQQ